MKKYTIYLFACIAVLVSACKKYEAQYEGEWKDSKPAEPVVPPNQPPKPPATIALAASNNIYMTDLDGVFLKQVTATDNNIKTNAMISPKYDKIAYYHNGQIRVIDTAGNILASNLGPSSTIRYFNWYSDNNLLYGVNYNTRQIVPLVGTLPAGLPQPIYRTSYNQLINVAYITAEKDLLYSRSSTNIFGTPTYDMVYAKNGATTTPQAITLNNALTDLRCNKTGTLAFANTLRISIKNRSISIASNPAGNTNSSCPLSDTTVYLAKYYTNNAYGLHKVNTQPPKSTIIFTANPNVNFDFDTK